jgi:hypothetical protein
LSAAAYPSRFEAGRCARWHRPLLQNAISCRSGLAAMAAKQPQHSQPLRKPRPLGINLLSHRPTDDSCASMDNMLTIDS